MSKILLTQNVGETVVHLHKHANVQNKDKTQHQVGFKPQMPTCKSLA